MSRVESINVNWLVLDYVAVCESRRELLDFDEFIPLWIAANEIAGESDQTRVSVE